MVLLALIFLLTLFDSTSALTVANEELHYTGPVISDFEELPGFAYSGTSIETWSSYEEAVAGCLSDENCHGFYSRDFTTFDKGSCSLENPNCCHSVGETVPYTGECNSSGELKFGSHCDCKVLTEHSQWTAWVKSKKLLCPAVSGVAGCNQWATNSVNALNGADFPAIKDQAECREKCALSKDCTSYMLHPTHGCALYKTLDGCTGNHGWTGYQMNCIAEDSLDHIEVQPLVANEDLSEVQPSLQIPLTEESSSNVQDGGAKPETEAAQSSQQAPLTEESAQNANVKAAATEKVEADGLSSMLDSFFTFFTKFVEQGPKEADNVSGNVINIFSFHDNEIGGDVNADMQNRGSQVGSHNNKDKPTTGKTTSGNSEASVSEPKVGIDSRDADSDSEDANPEKPTEDTISNPDNNDKPADVDSDSDDADSEDSKPVVHSSECMSEENVLERSRPIGNMNYVTPPQNVINIQNILSEENWDELFAFRNELYQYEYFLRSAAIWPHFCSDASLCATELSYVFSHMTQETGMNNPSVGPVWKQGLYHFSEMCANNGGCSGYTAWDENNLEWWPPVEGAGIYHGRGAKQLTWNYNYGPFSLLMTGDKMTFLNNPELVEDPKYALSAAIWFYMTPQSPKPSMHDVVTGCWKPNSHDYSQGRIADTHANKMALTTHIINGGIECSSTGLDQPWKRFTYLVEFSNYFGLDDKPSLDDFIDCGTIGAFDTQAASADLLLFYESDWAFDNDPDNCGCKLVPWYTGYSRTLDMLGDCEKAKCGHVTGQSDCSKIGREHGWREGTITVNNCGSAAPASPSGGTSNLPNRCGTSWFDANDNCGNTRCLAQNSECPSGQKCWADVEDCGTGQTGNVDEGNQASSSNIPNRCGTTWTDANTNCGNTQCTSGQDHKECPNGQTCFKDLTIAPCETNQSGNNDQSNQGEISNRCGTSWEDANDNCGNVHCISPECPSGQTCFADLTIPSCGNNDQAHSELPACLKSLDPSHIATAGGLPGFTSETPDCQAYLQTDPTKSHCVYDHISEVCSACGKCADEQSRRNLNSGKTRGRRLLTL